MSSATDKAALAKLYRPDTAINLSPPDNTAVYLSDEIQQYITDQLGLVRPQHLMYTSYSNRQQIRTGSGSTFEASSFEFIPSR